LEQVGRGCWEHGVLRDLSRFKPGSAFRLLERHEGY
jgi:hypothetical protein